MSKGFGSFALSAVAVSSLVACQSNEPYKATPAWTGQKVSLPAPPTLPTNPIKSGDSYTVFGATHHLRSRIHEKDVTAKEISIVGYIVDTNIPRAPACAIHKVGKKDPDGCLSELPSFWIGDSETDSPGAPKIRVVGWASNYANVLEAMQRYGNRSTPPKELYQDEILSVDIPFPVPVPGTKIRLTGKYGYSYKGNTGVVSDPVNGVVGYKKIELIEQSMDTATFR